MSGSGKRRSVGPGTGPKRTRPYTQRCAVRVMYAKNTVAGHWRAHGRYVARESASQEGDPKAVGFDGRGESIDIAERLESWQKAGDERLWKLIVSPEFGDRADLKRLTRDLVSRMERDLGTPLQWVAAAHYNTEHPHVHVALRGIGAEDRPLRLSRDYVKQGIREIAEDLCTRQLGYRTELDAAAAQRREVHQHRYTSLDRIIKRDAEGSEEADSPFFTVATNPSRAGLVRAPLVEQHTAERLKVLESMGLAETAGSNTWRVRQDFENVLRAMQRSADRQKMLAAHGVLMSDERLPLVGARPSPSHHIGRQDLGAWGGGHRTPGRSQLLNAGRNRRTGSLRLLHARNGRGTRPRRSANQFVCAASKVVCRWPSGSENRRVGRFRGDLAQQAVPARNRATPHPARHRSATGRLEWMARALPEGASGGCGDCRTPTPHEGSGAP